MRARHRHFNPSGVGCVTVLDSRFISGLSNADAVETWSSRTGANDATQSTSARRPTYETNVFSGQPAVKFVKSNTQFLRTGNGPFGVTSQGFGLVVYSRNSVGVSQFGTGFNHGDYTSFAGTTYEVTFASNARTVGSLAASGSAGSSVTDSTARSQNEAVIACSRCNASAALNLRVNGTSVGNGSSLAGNLNNSSTPVGIGARGTGTVTTADAHDGHIALVIYSGSSISDAMRRKLEHAAAYSFKISCN
jgi:hypothetical protein